MKSTTHNVIFGVYDTRQSVTNRSAYPNHNRFLAKEFIECAYVLIGGKRYDSDPTVKTLFSCQIKSLILFPHNPLFLLFIGPNSQQQQTYLILLTVNLHTHSPISSSYHILSCVNMSCHCHLMYVSMLCFTLAHKYSAFIFVLSYNISLFI